MDSTAEGRISVSAFNRSSRKFAWDQKRVLVTGGSAGLGLVLARQLASKGVRLAVCDMARQTVRQAVDELRKYGGDVIGIECDVRKYDSVVQMFEEIDAEFGGVDVLFNAAGVVEVGASEWMNHRDFENFMETNCRGAFCTIRAAMPGMWKLGWGRIMNVALLGRQRAVTSMPPGVECKSGTVGLLQDLRTDFRHENILVSTACPGLIETLSSRETMFEDRHREKYGWFSIGDSLPLMSENAQEAASQIIDACQQGRGKFTVANPVNVAVHLQRYFPALKNEILTMMGQPPLRWEPLGASEFEKIEVN